MSLTAIRRWTVTVTAVLVVGLAPGCRPQPEPVRKVVVPLWQTGLAESPVHSRMLAAIALRDDATWTFKLVGPVAKVAELAEQVAGFLKAVEFDEAGEPAWTLPEGWTTHRRNADRFVTLEIPVQSGDPVELAVARLSAGQDLLANINRWRNQLSLKPVATGEIETSVERVAGADGELVVFDATGEWKQSAAMPPFAGGQMPGGALPGGATSLEQPAEGEAAAAIVGEIATPEGWSRDPDSPMVVASFRRQSDRGDVRLAISELPAALNSWDNSVGSWASEAGLEGKSPDELRGMGKAVEVGGLPGQRLELAGPEGDGARAVIGIRVECGQRAIYLKLTGDRAAVLDAVPVLEQFCVELKLNVPEPSIPADELPNPDR